MGPEGLANPREVDLPFQGKAQITTRGLRRVRSRNRIHLSADPSQLANVTGLDCAAAIVSNTAS